jgi:hypothetical protein
MDDTDLPFYYIEKAARGTVKATEPPFSYLVRGAI